MEIVVLGETVDDQTRCVHYGGPTDVVAIKFACCGRYYPCFQCHQECANHPAQQWPVRAWDQKAILCGVCQTEHTIAAYLGILSCPACGAQFNVGCRLHRHLYFATSDTPRPAHVDLAGRAGDGDVGGTQIPTC